MKTCFKCQKTLPFECFYKHKQMGDGYLGKCKECTRLDVTNNRNKNINSYREYDRRRGNRQSPEYRKEYRIKNIEKIKESHKRFIIENPEREHEKTKEYRNKYPNKYKATNMVNNFIRDGKLFKEPCCICGTTENTHAHHDDYAKPLNVRWLCAEHHSQWHRENGEGLNGS